MSNLFLDLLGTFFEITGELLLDLAGKSIRSLVSWKCP